jgi:hypothetical protein
MQRLLRDSQMARVAFGIVPIHPIRLRLLPDGL